jgi:hypothetical protein
MARLPFYSIIVFRTGAVPHQHSGSMGPCGRISELALALYPGADRILSLMQSLRLLENFLSIPCRTWASNLAGLFPCNKRLTRLLSRTPRQNHSG